MSNANRCFASLKPALEEIHRLIAEAPIDNKERAGLATMCAAYLLGAAAGAVQQAHPKLADAPLAEIARAVANTMVATVERSGRRPS